ncbi:hypothetical protein INR49_004384 [Caranx melampygus]|nr:hypothetical protein INR49_004384 [Caranx melampygus]
MGKPKKKSDLSRAELMMMTIADVIKQLVEAHEEGKDINLNKVKTKTSAKYGLEAQPRLVDIIAAVPPQYRRALVPKLKAKPIRTASGIAVVAVMCKPHRCPHISFTGNICVYCPGGPDSDFEYSTQSYTATSMRAIRARYDPYLQTRHRVEQRNRYSERSNTKCVGITIETRPDYCLKRHLSDMLGYGCTRLEIGVQSVYEDVARDTNRGHTVRAVCESFHLAKDAGFKVVAHMMPDLPNVGMERDVEQFIIEISVPVTVYSYMDIPMPLVSSGVEHGNLRELALARMKDMGTECRDVRTREVGIQEIHHKVRPYQGFGMMLMEEAERIARDEHGSGKLAVISGVGTRNYYRKMGYELEGPYMVKDLFAPGMD